MAVDCLGTTATEDEEGFGSESQAFNNPKISSSTSIFFIIFSTIQSNYLPPPVFRQKRVGFVDVEDKFFEVMQSIIKKIYQKQARKQPCLAKIVGW